MGTSGPYGGDWVEAQARAEGKAISAAREAEKNRDAKRAKWDRIAMFVFWPCALISLLGGLAYLVAAVALLSSLVWNFEVNSDLWLRVMAGSILFGGPAFIGLRASVAVGKWASK